jgi:hypothetical protein
MICSETAGMVFSYSVVVAAAPLARRSDRPRTSNVCRLTVNSDFREPDGFGMKPFIGL